MNLRFNNKLVLVTGSTSGLGFNIAKTFLNLGATVIFNSRAEKFENSEQLNEKKFFYYPADLSNAQEAKSLLEKIKYNHGNIDNIICNVGNGRSTDYKKNSSNEIKWMLEVNLFTSTNIISIAKNYMNKSNSTIICISSICGIEVLGAPVGYNVAKAALNMYIKSMSKVLAKYSIRINGIAPGNLYFKGSTWEQKIMNDEFSVMQMIKKEVALQKFGVPEDISNFVVFLSSKYASFATGEIFTVDGGQLRSL